MGVAFVSVSPGEEGMASVSVSPGEVGVVSGSLSHSEGDMACPCQSK